ncbi:LytTR family DNA-binding domain-containing protein [Spongiivirga sp. MCCC 1A20706]|uniref:LytR/AlgR family response regulator transcription factor n=1 Tax=Spongiivirga sp. MCCC 1A20706 TaxID=3160963 RepID=UPI003977733B
MNCIIIDDEPLAARVIENHLKQIENLELIGRFEHAMDAFSFLQSNVVDLIFLDIQMPKINGLSFLKSLKKRPHVILCTAYREYALEGFELDVVDYLLKPIAFERFLQSVDKVFRISNAHLQHTIPSQPIAIEKADHFIFVKSDKENVKVNLDTICYIESLKNHIRIHTENATVTTLKPISAMEDRLPPQRFIRIHRSYIVALHKVTSFTQTQVTIGKKALPIGRLYKQEALRRLQIHIF